MENKTIHFGLTYLFNFVPYTFIPCKSTDQFQWNSHEIMDVNCKGCKEWIKDNLEGIEWPKSI